MKKYNVENLIDDREQALGRIPFADISDDYVGDYIIAENEEDAITFAIEYLADEINSSSYIDNDGEEKHYYTNIDWETKSIEVYECFDEESFLEAGYHEDDWDENEYNEEEMTKRYECKNCKMKIVELYRDFTAENYDEEEEN